MIPWLNNDTPFPDVSLALTDPPGLLAAGGDLSPARLMTAYRHGIFPWFSEGQPVLWWSTDPRMVLYTNDFHLSHSLKKTLKKIEKSRQTDQVWDIRFDSDFESVMRACAAPRDGEAGTWISEEIIQGYCGLHESGYAHSSEVWLNGQLVGGAYGVCIGHMFYGESMFARVTDASKIALAYLVNFLRQQGVEMIDCQQETNHLASLGGKPISRRLFLQHLYTAIQQPPILKWQPVPIDFNTSPV